MSLVIAELERLWSSNTAAPDLVSWWSATICSETAVTVDELLSALHLDQQQRWKTSQPWKVEDYLLKLSELPPGLNWRQKLVAGEIEARRNTPAPLTHEELAARFPDLVEQITTDVSGRLALSDQNSAPTALQATAISEQTQARIGVSGRYRLDEILGEGAFGLVYLGWDEELERQVAIKIPKTENLSASSGFEQYLREAQAAAGLSHPNIVTVFDVGRTDTGLIYVVSQFIRGETLQAQLQKSRPDFRRTAELLSAVALALHHSHTTRRLIHRDVKPANILIEESSGKPYVADFGLAIRADQSIKDRSIAGSPHYMSPEQARGEGHRLDSRSDIFSMGVIFYEMLTGVRPFRGSGVTQVLSEVIAAAPTAPRAVEASVPAELERICLKALSKRASDRYSTAAEFAADLQAWLQPATVQSTPRRRKKLEPKGLRSFDEQDKDFFLDLLPGGRDRDDLPESILFWKQRIEECAAEQTFSVGLIYGPSGCGKSSLVKAGLLPSLRTDIVTICLEATPHDTERQLCNALRRHRDLPNLPAHGDIADLFAALRRSPGPKVVVFLDQFEQWLLANKPQDTHPLVLALRQCDGARLQTVLMIRDDFFVSVSRLMRELDIPLVQQQNFLMVDLFDTEHACEVLHKFGTAYGRLPAPPLQPSAEQSQFLQQAVCQLASGDKVSPVKLALFAQMVHKKNWEPGTLLAMGGLAGVGVAFLEETFTRDARYRQHQKAVRNLLLALLPNAADDIKGGMQTAEFLQIEAGLKDRDHEFQELLRILNSDLRLITPLDVGSEEQATNSVCYQLTHDYLVPSIREWLRLNQTPAERILEDRTRRWSEKCETRQLPSLMEYGAILLQTDRTRWTEPQRMMLRSATRIQAFRSGLVLFLFAGLFLLAGWLRQQGDIARAESLAASVAQTKTSELAAGLVPLQLLREYALPTLQKLYTESAETSEARLHLAIARLQLGDPDPDLLQTARDRALECRPEQLPPLTKLLQPWAAQLLPELQQVLQSEQQPAGSRLHAACLLAAWEATDGEKTAWAQPATASFVAAQLAAQNPVFVGAYQEVLRPQASRLTPPLATLFADPAQTEVARTIVTGLLADYAREDLPVLVQLLLAADPAADKLLFPLLEADRARAITEFQAVLQQQLTTDWADPPLNPAWSEPAETLKIQIAAAHGLIAERFAFCMDMPLAELLDMVATLKPSGYRPTRLRPVVGQFDALPRMSAVWVRDGGKFAVQPGVKQTELPKPDENAIRDGLLLADLAFVPGNGPQSGWLTLWNEPTVEGEERRCLVAVDEESLQAGIYRGAATEGVEQNLFQLTLSVHNEADGKRLYSAVYSTFGVTSEALASWPGHGRLDLVQRDVSSAANDKLPLIDRRVTNSRNLDQIAKLSAAQLEQWENRLARGIALYEAGQLELALADFDWLATLPTPNLIAQRYRCLALARVGRQSEASKLYADILQHSLKPALLDYVTIQLKAASNDYAGVATVLEAASSRHAGNVDDLYCIASAAAIASQIFHQLNFSENASILREKSLTLLTRCIDEGFENGQYLSGDSDFSVLHDEPRFMELLAHSVKADRSAGLWDTDPTMECLLLRSKSAEDLQTQIGEKWVHSWRPVSVSLDVFGGNKTALVVLRRPLIADARKEALAIRQGAAAVALLRLGDSSTVWPLLQSQPDPRLRSEILHRLSLYGVDGRALMTQLTAESGSADPAVVSRRRSLIQGLGELAAAKLLPPPLVAEATADLLERFVQDPDSGVHGMCEWTLRQLGAAEQMQQAEQQFRTGDAIDGRRWYLTKTGGTDPADRGFTFAIIDATEPFVMGSPLSEAERKGDPTGRHNLQNEHRHRRRIGRVVAIGVHEVTVSQFLKFRPQHDFSRSFSPTLDSPVNAVSWYDAAAYCNWLSEQEGLDSSKWCYEPGDQGYAEGMRSKENFTELQGYRLPTEAEWERIARVETVTAHFFGESDRLLGAYAWYTKNSGDKFMQPVSTLRPNGAGVFGLYGNAAEWCMDRNVRYSSEASISGDFGQRGQVLNIASRVSRGGSFLSNAAFMRSANRGNFGPIGRYSSHGFRVSRTYHLRP